MEEFKRTEMLIGSEGLKRLSLASVIVFGVGGVGGYAAEALVRSGVGRVTLVDFDTVAESNLNRQIIATKNVVGMKKTQVAKERFLSINPNAEIETFDEFYDENSAIDLSRYDYVVDAIDSVPSKVFLIREAKRAGVPIISCLSAGNKLDPTAFRVGDIYSTKVCPLARVLRKKLKEVGVEGLKTVWSDEEPKKPLTESDGKNVGSVMFVTGVAGLIAAGEVIKDLTKESL